MPSAPHLDGLPLWLQIIATVAFGLGTILVAFKAYRPAPKLPESADNAQIIGASFADMGAVRRLGDVCIELGAKMESLEQAIREHTHFVREGNELMRDGYDRLRDFQNEREIERRVAARSKGDGG